MQISAALDLHHRQLLADGRSPHTINSSMRDLLLLAAHLGDVEVQAVTPDHVARFILSDAVQKRADGTPKTGISVNHFQTRCGCSCGTTSRRVIWTSRFSRPASERTSW